MRRVYRNVLDREPDQAGLEFWSGQLERGARNRGQVMTGFSESSEFSRDDVARGRRRSSSTRPCSAGPRRSAEYRDWTYRFAADGTVATRVSQILGSSEYARRVELSGPRTDWRAGLACR